MLSVALLTVRLSVSVALSPAFAAYGVPAIVRIALTLALAALTFASRAPVPAAAAWVDDPALLIKPVSAELFIGVLLGLGVHVVLAALALAGRLLDVQVGFAIGSIFDPVTRTQSNVLGALMTLIGVTVFVASGAHLQLAQLVSQSLDLLPLGELPPLEDPMRMLVATGAMFSLGLAFAGPVAVSLLLADLAIGVASRNMPQVNVLVLAMPIKMILAYGVLAVAVLSWSPLLEAGFALAAAQL